MPFLAALAVLLSFARVARAADPKAPPPAYVDSLRVRRCGRKRGRIHRRISRARASARRLVARRIEPTRGALHDRASLPEHPDASCLDRIGGLVEDESFFLGQREKSAAQARCWPKFTCGAKTKATRLTQTFSDNLRDQNDEVLRRIAAHAFAKLAGETVPALLSVSIRPHDVEGTIVVDGVEAATIDEGAGSLELKPGPHVIAVKAKGYKTSTNRVAIDPGKEVSLAVKLEPGTDEPARAAVEANLHEKKFSASDHSSSPGDSRSPAPSRPRISFR